MVTAKVVSDGADVYLLKLCPEHGERRVRIRSGPDDYIKTLRYVKPASQPLAFSGDSGAACTKGCGYCERHEQHLCMPIIEVTGRCDLSCPVCLNSSGGVKNDADDMTIESFRAVLDRIISAERQVDILNISGGEPLLHPSILGLVDEALSRSGVVRVSVSTNGLAFLKTPELVDELKARDVVISLQFDGFGPDVYRTLRGKDLSAEKAEILAMLKDADATASLTMTAAGGLSEPEFPRVLELLFASPNIVSLMVQPVAFTGRGASLDGHASRLSIPDVIGLLSAQGQSIVAEDDFVPLPCSHPLCFSLAFYLMTGSEEPVSLNRLVDAATLMDCLANRVVFGLDPAELDRVRELVYELWSGPAGQAPEGRAALDALRSLLREFSGGEQCCFDPRSVFSGVERRVKSIFIHAFQDADTFDLARARRCCNAYATADGRLLPSCVRNVLHNGRQSAQ